MHFEIQINASPEKVWDAVVDHEKYREWTSVFHEGSYFEGGWETGDKIQFIALNEKGEKEGMFSEIAESKKPRFISIRHLGTILGGKEDTEGEAAKKWVPVYENYTLTPVGEGTKFEVDVDSFDASLDEMFSGIWPKALKKLKEIAEKQT
jgi:uncharacterized protein YndB with AHSA1/START domain